MLTSDYIVGLTDGEGSFCVYIRKPEKKTWHTRIECHYYIKLREDDRALLVKVKNFFGCGRIDFQKEYRENQRDNYRYQVSSLRELREIIIPFFKGSPLQSKRIKDFSLFCTIVELVVRKAHHTSAGLRRISQLKNRMH
ncbi:LAGLIDADG family homing endonuclease [Candidatus Uhrbacteria bacterium]|nr:LAGLIDADG family homing endonuclease [Candidatus Uhrbacteria bacterium]